MASFFISILTSLIIVTNGLDPLSYSHQCHDQDNLYFIPLYGYSDGGTPLVNIKIENESIITELDLGFTGKLSMKN